MFGDTSNSPSIVRLLAYDHPWLRARLIACLRITEADATCLFQDTLRFLYVQSLRPDCDLPPPAHIELCWREFILFTRDYHDFCLQFFGKYIHYQPRDPTQSVDMAGMRIAQELVLRSFGGRLSGNWLPVT
jgi:hypothetical protein